MVNTLKLTADQRLRSALLTFRIQATGDLSPNPCHNRLVLVPSPAGGGQISGPRRHIENRPHIQMARNLALGKGKKF